MTAIDLIPAWLVRRRVARMCAHAAAAEAAAEPFRAMKAYTDTEPVGDPLTWPVEPVEPPALYEAIACPAVSAAGQRCERVTGHRTKAHMHALEVHDPTDVRVVVWRTPKVPA